MIKRIFETHLEVKDMEKAIKFYQDKLGLTLGLGNATKNAAFFWVGEPGESMLGLWLVPDGEEVTPNHFAFEVDLEFIMNSKEWLEERGIDVLANKGMSNEEPCVHPWMPAASVYFNDPDGNKLEFITMLSDNPMVDGQPRGKRIYLSKWMQEIEAGKGK